MKSITTKLFIILLPIIILWSLQNILINGNDAKYCILDFRYMINYISNMTTENLQNTFTELKTNYNNINLKYMQTSLEMINSLDTQFLLSQKIIYILTAITYSIIGITQYIYYTLIGLTNSLLIILDVLIKTIQFIFNPKFTNIKNIIT